MIMCTMGALGVQWVRGKRYDTHGNERKEDIDFCFIC